MNVARILKDKGRDVATVLPETSIKDVIGLLAEPVSDHMTRDVVTCAERDTVAWLMEEMTSHRFRHMPVVDGGRLAGIVSIGDVVKQRIALAEMEASSMRDYIKTG